MLSQKEKLIKDGWIETTLGEVCVLISRGVTPNYSENDGIIILNQKCIRDWVVSFNDARMTVKYSEDKLLLSGDILINSTGVGTLGRVAQIKSVESKITVDSHVSIIRSDQTRTDVMYLGYLLKGSEKEIEFMAEGSTGQTELSRLKLKSLPILLPPLTEQKSIATVLSSFDDKIELLREENKTLEEIGKTIFKEWFGKYSEGDELIKAENILEFEKGIEVGSSNYFENRFQVKNPEMFYRVRDISNNGNLSSIYCEKDLLKNKIFKTDDILISFDGTVGRVFIGGNGGYSSGIRRVYSKEKNIKNSFLYFWAKSKQVQETINLYSEGTTIQHAGKSITYLKIISNQEHINKITEILDPVFTKILDNLYQIQSLSNGRDELLPRLVKGEVRV